MAPETDLLTASVPRPRRRNSVDLPANLYEPRAGYFVYRNPANGTSHALGRISRREAIAQAIEANHFIEKNESIRVVERLHAEKEGGTFGEWLNRFQVILDRRDLSDNTRKSNKSKLKAIRAEFGDDPMATLERNVGRWADWLDSIVETGKGRWATALRSTLVDCWREAIAAGKAERNPVEITRVQAAKVQRDRLTLDAFRILHATALEMDDLWLARSLEIGLVTAQRREDINAMQFRKRADATAWVEGDGLYVIQQKTGNRLILPLDLHLEALGMSVGDVIERCRSGAVVSSWLIHHNRSIAFASIGDQVHIDTLSRGFKRVRDRATELGHSRMWNPGKEPPTFHELRSLSIRLYTEQFSAEFAQAVAGHKSVDMTNVYRDLRGSEWARVFKTTT